MNTLSKDVEIKGSITFAHQLIIEGKVDGDVISKGDLTVGENGQIKGQVTASNVVIFGKIEGNVTAQQRCHAKATATILGDITAGAFAAEEGATFMGRSRVGKAAVAAAAAAAAPVQGQGAAAPAPKPAAVPGSGPGPVAQAGKPVGAK